VEWRFTGDGERCPDSTPIVSNSHDHLPAGILAIVPDSSYPLRRAFNRSRSRIAQSAGAVALVALLAGCGSASEQPAPSTAASPSVTAVPSPAPSPAPDRAIVGTVVRFTSPNTSVDVTIGEDSPATRDFLSMLPLTISIEEYTGREKISYLPRELNHEGSPGTDPEDGDLIYFTPWGNLGFYYNASGIDYSDQTLHIGTYNASREQLTLLEGEDITVQIVE
jgi:hypothetical protein